MLSNTHLEFEPTESLLDTIKCFWYERREFGDTLSNIEVVPDGYAEIIFHFGNGCSISHNGKSTPLPSPFMMGLLNHTVTFQARGRLEIIGVRCFPWTIFDLLGLSSTKEKINIVEHSIAALHTRLHTCIEAGKIEEAISIVKAYVANARSHVSVDTMLFKAGAAMKKSRGTITVSQVAEEAHASVRTLERKFKRSTGHSVKDVSGLMRFEQVRNQLWINPDATIAGLAHDFGYTDQSHLSREFKRYSGTTPAAFARKAKQRREVMDDHFVAFIQS